MKYLALVIATLVGLACADINCLAQTPANIYAAGVSYNHGATPSIAGTALYAHSVDSSGTYAFTVYDALPASTKPFTVTSNVGLGLAQKLFTIHNVPVFAPTSAGVSFTGSNTGWQWNGGIAASVKIKGNWHAYPTVRFLKSSVGGSGYQVLPSILFGWAQ